MKNWRSNKISFIKFIELAEKVAQKHNPDTWERKLNIFPELLKIVIEYNQEMDRLFYQSQLNQKGMENRLFIKQIIKKATQ